MELFMRLGLKEIASIVGTLGVSTEIPYLHGSINVDGKLYIYEKKDNQITIKDEEGRKTTIAINYSEERGKDYQNRDVIFIKHEILFDYLLSNGEHISFYKDVALDRGYESFENVRRHDLLQGLRTRYVDKDNEDIASFSLELDKICLSGSKKVFEFSRDGILTGNRLITVDGDKLVSISGFETPSEEEARDFDLEKEKAKIEGFLKSRDDLHPFTREILEDAIRKLDRKSRYAKDIIGYYDDDIKEVRTALAVRNSLLKDIDSYVMDPDALDQVSMKFRKDVFANKNEHKRSL